MRRRLAGLALCLAVGVGALATLASPNASETVTIGPSDCSASTVNTALAAASAGDTVLLTCTGTVNWTATVTISGGKTLKGSGAFNASDATNHGTWPLTINSTADPFVQITNDNSQQTNRLTGLKITNSASAAYGISVTGRGTGVNNTGAFRIDNVALSAPTALSVRLVLVDGTTGPLTGLLDHNLFSHADGTVSASSLLQTHQSWRGSSSGCYGYDSLNRPIVWGGTDFVFFEDNFFWNTGVDSAGSGTRYVFRRNTFDSDQSRGDLNPIDGHGADMGGWHAAGTVAGEVYENTVIGTGSSYAQFVYARSGKWLIYDNEINNGVIQFREQRALASECMGMDWLACDGAHCCATPAARCPTDSDYASAHPLPNQVQATYVWGNAKGATPVGITISDAVYNPTYIQAGVDVFTSEHSYTPYQYPHPLTLAPAAPSGVRIGGH